MTVSLEISHPSGDRDDLDAIAEVWQASYASAYVGTRPELTAEVVGRHTATRVPAKLEYWRQINNRHDCSLVVGRLGSAVVGYSIVSFLDNDEVTQLNALYRDPAYRRRSIGLQLAVHQLRLVPKDRDVVLGVAPGTSAVGFYASLGFRQTGRDISNEWPILDGKYRLPLIDMCLPADEIVTAIDDYNDTRSQTS